MKTTFNKVLQAAVAATVLTFAGVSHAADYGSLNDPKDLTHEASPVSSSFFGKNVLSGGKLQISAALIEMVNADDFSQKTPVYCIEPTVEYVGGLYSLNDKYVVSQGVRKLFESSYASTLLPTTNQSISQSDMQFAFQLALWELTHDDGTLTLTSGKQFYDLASEHQAFQTAENMLINAQSTSLAVEHYKYFAFESQDGGQALLGVSAVPEADTWAMMALGLGMLGLVGRRQQKNEKFA